jgi:hypothetical protein
LDVRERLHAWKPGAEDVGAANDSVGVLGAFVITPVVVTAILATKGWGVAADAIFVEMVTGTERHWQLQKRNQQLAITN